MGADFIYYALTWVKGQKLDWNAGKAYIRKLAKDSYKEEKEEIPEDERDLVVSCNFGINYTVSDLEMYMEDVQYGIGGRRRDCNVCHLGHLEVLLTGGMSWGDSPTDLCGAMQAIWDCEGLAKAIGFNQFEYNYKEMVDKILSVPAVLPMIMHLDDELDKLIEPKLKEIS